jgi:hypothetical protein
LSSVAVVIDSGAVVTVRVLLVETEPKVAEIVVVPTETPVAIPAPSTVARVVSEEAHVT